MIPMIATPEMAAILNDAIAAGIVYIDAAGAVRPTVEFLIDLRRLSRMVAEAPSRG